MKAVRYMGQENFHQDALNVGNIYHTNHEDKMSNPNTAEETKAERCMKSDIAAVVNYFEESDLTDEELINLSADMERIAKQHTAQTLDRLKGEVEEIPQTEAGCGIVVPLEAVLNLIEEVSDENE